MIIIMHGNKINIKLYDKFYLINTIELNLSSKQIKRIDIHIKYLTNSQQNNNCMFRN